MEMFYNSRCITSSPAACAALTYSIPSAKVKASSNFESAPASYERKIEESAYVSII